MNSRSSKIGPTSGRAACALLVTCALISSAGARQSQTSSSDAVTRPAIKTNASSASKSSSGSKSSTAKSSGTKSTTHSGKSSRKKKSSRSRGQQKIDSERAQAIQAALIREHYLTGEPSGTWNQACEEAMRRYQSDHGWQTKEVPDSRALISLGLGPSNDHLLNPESAMTTGPAERGTPVSTPASRNIEAGAASKTSPPDAHTSATPTDTAHPQ